MNLFFDKMGMKYIKGCRDKLHSGDRTCELYVNPITRSMFERWNIDDNTDWKARHRDDQHYNRVDGSTIASLEMERREIMSRQREVDSHDLRSAVGNVFRDIVEDVVPIVNYYLLAMYPLHLVPESVDVIMSWVPKYNFTGVGSMTQEPNKTFHTTKSCTHIEYGACMYEGAQYRVVWCSDKGDIRFQRESRIYPNEIVQICIERLVKRRHPGSNIFVTLIHEYAGDEDEI